MKLNYLILATLVLPACDMGMLNVRHAGSGEADTPFTGYPNVELEPQPGPSSPTSPVQNVPEILTHATWGERCVDGERVGFLVLSDLESTCTDDAQRIDAPDRLERAVVFRTEELGAQQLVDYCVNGTCETTTLDVTFNAGNGTWSGTLAGFDHQIEFSALSCAYDTALVPTTTDRLAGGISIKSLAMYQGVKVGLAADGEPLAERNAPVVAGRPGVLRVFVEPQSDWQARPLNVRLTLGDQVLEQTFTPQANSTETNFGSTVNFQFDEGELPANVEYSVELLEVDPCAAPPAELAQPRFPALGTVELGSEAINPMRVVLVPIQYDADGSGRTPNLDQAALERWRQHMFVNYPVSQLEVTARDPVATNQGLAPNGSGFSSMLNLCLGVRQQDNPAPDVYYYCVIQPSASRSQFCGGGCVGGVAPLAPANSVSSRAGIGIAFDGTGEDIFVHEIGHALGRPHAPCGGAAGTDPDFPHAGGRIGTWGYDVVNNALIDPQAPDFMGYCDPSWVSDYTYDAIFERLKYVLGVQSQTTFAEPRTWRTGAIENGAVVWGNTIESSTLPAGVQESATLLDEFGLPLADVEIWVTEVSCDIETLLFSVEDFGPEAASIVVRGVSITL